MVVAERTGRPHSAKTDEAGRYRIDDVPVGQYVPSAIAPGYDEAVAVDSLGIPRLATVAAGMESEAPTILLKRAHAGQSARIACGRGPPDAHRHVHGHCALSRRSRRPGADVPF